MKKKDVLISFLILIIILLIVSQLIQIIKNSTQSAFRLSTNYFIGKYSTHKSQVFPFLLYARCLAYILILLQYYKIGKYNLIQNDFLYFFYFIWRFNILM